MNIDIDNITIGGDPEFFAQDSESKRIIPIAGLFSGTKENPHQLNNGGFQVDNVLGEINIAPTKVSNQVQWFHNVTNLLRDALNHISEQGLEFSVASSHLFEAEEFFDPGAYVFGCAADYDVWQIEEVVPPSPHDVGGFRSAGGHITLGGFDFSGYSVLDVGRAMDYILGLSFTILGDDVTRKALYGQASRFRPTSFSGIEYRTPSNLWLWSPEVISVIPELCMIAIDNIDWVKENIDIEGAWKIKQAINTGDVELAKALLMPISAEEQIMNDIVNKRAGLLSEKEKLSTNWMR